MKEQVIDVVDVRPGDLMEMIQAYMDLGYSVRVEPRVFGHTFGTSVSYNLYVIKWKEEY